MASAAARATKRAVVDHANKATQAVNLALQVSTQIGVEWRTFANLTFVGRLRWLLTGRIRAAATTVPDSEDSQ